MQSSPRSVLTACLAALFIAGCASGGGVHVAPDESKPHITFELRSGGSEGDESFVCGSVEPGKPCVLAAGTGKGQTLAVVNLRVHAAAQPTSYLGVMRASFFEGEAERRVGEINTTVKPGSRPVGTTVIGRVTSKPGTYALVISIDATQPGAPNPVHIGEDVQVIVK